MADRPLPPRPRTAGRPLPPRSTSSDPGSAVIPAAGPPSLSPTDAAPAAPQLALGSEAARPVARPTMGDLPAKSRPDARPMRLVFGAGGIAAISIMTVGLVKPDLGASADLADAIPSAADASDALPTGEASGRDRDGRQVVRYVYLQPGQRPPAGAQVISAREAARRLGIGTPGSDARAARPERTRADRQPAPAATRRPEPPVTTRQSGRG